VRAVAKERKAAESNQEMRMSRKSDNQTPAAATNNTANVRFAGAVDQFDSTFPPVLRLLDPG
jgi:hypothetical protein